MSNKKRVMSQRRIDLHNQFGMNVRFMPDGDAGDAGDAGDTAAAAADTAGAFTIPDQYKDKPYLKDIDSHDKVFDLLDKAETLVGKKRSVIPDEHTSDEDRVEFHRSRGVPDNDTGYTPIDKTDGADNSLFDALRPAFKKADITQSQLERFIPDVMEAVKKMSGVDSTTKAENDAEFETLTTEIFGATKAQDMAQAKTLLQKYAPEKMMGHINDLDNKSLVAMAAVFKGIRKDFMNEDGTALGGGATGDLSTAETLKAQTKVQVAIAQDPKSSPEQKEAAKKKANELCAQYATIVDKK